MKFNIKPQTCDLVFFSGKNLIARLIQLFTNSKWSHVGIVYNPNESSPVFFDATTNRVQVQLLSDILKKRRKQKPHLFRYKGELSRKNKEMMIVYAIRQIGKKYDVNRLFEILFYITLNIRKLINLKYRNMFICSGYISRIYRVGGVDIGLNVDDEVTIPQDIVNSGLFKDMGELKLKTLK